MHVCFVHAHPDDETLASGALIAHLVRLGHQVSVLTATRGERGEVVPGEFSHLAGTPGLHARREQELDEALAVLGVAEHAFLGTPPARDGLEPRVYRDSGMRWVSDQVAGPADDIEPDSLCEADEADVVADLVAWLRHVAADAVVTYDADGGYGHPDHVLVHHTARTAADVLGLDFAVLVPQPGGDAVWFRLERYLPVVADALRRHRSQLRVHDDGATITHCGGQVEPIVTSVGLRGTVPQLSSE